MKNKIQKNFRLNKMQEEAFKLRGKNINLEAPTASGKTEAILLNMKKGEVYNYFLPTITSSIFMFKRLKDKKYINLEIQTSKLTEEYLIDNTKGKIIISCPDNPLLNVIEKKGKIKNVILDEIDSYPDMIQSVLIELINNKQFNHFIVASATMDKSLQESLKNTSVKIKYNEDLKINKFKIKFLNYFDDIVDVIKNNKEKRICIISNSIKDMNIIKKEIEYQDIEVDIFHNSEITEYEYLENEKKIYDENYNILVSNDLISYSIDINPDILIVQGTDELNRMIQRMGRVNRVNYNIKETNLYVLKEVSSLPFLNEEGVYKIIDEIEQAVDDNNIISYKNYIKLKKNIPSKNLPEYNEVINYLKSLKKQKRDLNLRQVPLSLKVPVEIEIKQKKIKTFRTLKIRELNGEIEYGYFPYCSKKDAKKKIKNVVRIKNTDYKILKNKDGNGKYIGEEIYETFGICPECENIISSNNFHWGYNMCYSCKEDDYDDDYDYDDY